MKHIIYCRRVTGRMLTLLFALSLTGLLSSCSKFLDLKPRDVKILKSAEDYRDLLASYLKFIKTTNPEQPISILGGDPFTFPKFNLSGTLGIYTGEAVLSPTRPFVDEATKLYTASGRNFLLWGITKHYKWEQDFRFLGPINLIILNVQDAEGDDQHLKDMVKGEALTWRAYTYFKLLQLYCPYEGEPYGLPLYLDPSLDVGIAQPERATLSQTYAQIIKDANEALELLKRTPYSDWNFAYRPDFLHAMLSSIYLYKAGSGAKEEGDYRQALEHAKAAIGQRKLETDPERLRRLFNASDPYSAAAFNSDEYSIRIIDGDNSQIIQFTSYYKGNTTGFTTNEFISLFSEDDKRKNLFLDDYEVGKIRKWELTEVWTSSHGILMPYRLAEMILNKAEAEAQLGMTAEATATLKEFTDARYSKPQPTPAPTDLIPVIRLERKREFFCENDVIWLDMKRFGEEVTREINGTMYTLKGDDYRYTFPIPGSELEDNKKMVQNPGWENVILQ